MPYIDKEYREELKTRNPQNAGEINYLVTLLMIKHFKDYQTANEIASGIRRMIISFTSPYPHSIFQVYTNFDKELSALFKDEVTRASIQAINKDDIIGALECALAEFYRRKVGPYEDVKAMQNGDVYE